MWQAFKSWQIKTAGRAEITRDEVYRKRAEEAIPVQQKIAEDQQRIVKDLSDTKNRISAREKMLRNSMSNGDILVITFKLRDRWLLKMKGRSMKWLRVLHLLSSCIWFGATVCIGVLAVICFFYLNETDFLIAAPIIPELYKILILPAAVFTILQGFVYGFFTKWGFFRHRWVVLKWILILLLIPCIGVGGIAHLFSAIKKINTSGFTGGFVDGGLVLLFISLQILIMLIMFGISVFKPMKKKR